MPRCWILVTLFGAAIAFEVTPSPRSIARKGFARWRGRVQCSARSPGRLGMISNLFNTDTGSLPKLPRDVKEAVSNCRESTQAALSNKISRMTVDFPVGTKFGVEKGGTKQKREGETPTRKDLEKSDRELARIFVEMFQPVGSENLVVAFNDVDAADDAKKRWKGDPSAGSRILSMDRKRSSASKKKKKSRSKGFAAKMAAEIEASDDGSGPFELPEHTEVALFVAPGPKELIIIERICESAGMGTLVVLLNARLENVEKFASSDAKTLFTEEFEPVFCLSAAPQEDAPGCLLYRAYDKDWVLARKPAVGQPKTILLQSTRPTGDECRAAFENLELSEVEKNVESAIENVANWLR